MEWDLLAKAIHRQLLVSGSAALPGLGVLRLQSEPARLHRLEARMTPPRDFPVLDPAPETFDLDPGLVTIYAQLAGAPSGLDVRQEILERLQGLAQRIGSGGEIDLADVGRFIGKEGGTPVFQASDINYNLDMYGLGPVPARPVLKRTAAAAARAAIDERRHPLDKPVLAAPSRRLDRWVLPLVAAALILSLGASLWLILAPSGGEAEPARGLEASVPAEDADRSGAGDITEEVLGEETDTLPDMEEPPLPEEPSRAIATPERIVVGHFGQSGNADGAIRTLEGMGLLAIREPGRGNLTRVVVLVDPDSQSSGQILQRIRNEFEPTAYIDH